MFTRNKEPRDTYEMSMRADERAEKTDLIGHQKRELWMGADCLTLADLWPQNPRAILVGINPAAASVEVGHYYEGLAGRRMFGMLRDAGVLRSPCDEDASGLHDDDLALARHWLHRSGKEADSKCSGPRARGTQLRRSNTGEEIKVKCFASRHIRF